MPGTKSSGRPGGNPDIKEYGFKTNRAEPLRENLQVRVSTSMMKQIKSIENWHEFVRVTLAKGLKERENISDKNQLSQQKTKSSC